ncbi:hypothetical protein MTO96_037857 [Rhipicephalus appendiculatus]
MRQFLSSRERIWTVKTNKHANIHCKADIFWTMGHFAVGFNRTLLQNERRISVRLLGHIDRQHAGRMAVFPIVPIPRPISIETLVYKAPNSACAVVHVSSLVPGIRPHYELRVKSSFLWRGPQEDCERQFSFVAPDGRIIYNRTCLFRLRPTP